MRHNKKFNHLSRQYAHRHAMLANMSVSLIAHKRITTTLAKAKALKKYVEPLINRCKEDTTHSRRMVFKYLQSKEAVTELFQNVAPAIGDRAGGYTRIVKLGLRKGDAAPIAFIELVDFDENMAKTEKVIKKTRRSRRSGTKSEAPATEAPAVEEQVVEDAPATEEPVVEDAPAAEEPVVEEVSAAEEPVVEEVPAAEEPVVEEAPAAEEPVVEDAPAAEEPVKEAPTEAVAPEEEKPDETTEG